MTVGEGEGTTLDCVIVGKPEPEVLLFSLLSISPKLFHSVYIVTI